MVVIAERALQAAELDADFLAQLAVERGERLVEQQDVGLEDDRARERHALLLPAGELAAAGAPRSRSAAPGAAPPPRGGAISPRDSAAHLERERDVVEDRHVREQRVALEHQPDVALRGGQHR